MRLVDADALIELIQSRFDLLFDEFTEKALIQMINEQPTAYDAERVEVQLMTEALDSASIHIEALNEKNACLVNYHGGKMDAFNRAIRIVRNGGVDDE